ncbi:hypothetical protein B0H14DRAFT_1456342 [Mycena olivaceomarginata]|nr:hypothetical protein B0H14DRAFT_1456342 [Mycena olivaceomarginata]
MFISLKALLGFVSLVGLIVPSALGAPPSSVETGLTLNARESVANIGGMPGPTVDAGETVANSLALDARDTATTIPFTAQLNFTLYACVGVKDACNDLPAEYAAAILKALGVFFGFLLGSINISNPSSSCLGAMLSGLYTDIFLKFLSTLTRLTIIEVIKALTAGGVPALWALCGGLPSGMNSAETAFCNALGLFYTALANALGLGCLPSLISAILVAINTLLIAIIALVNAIAACTVCSVTSVLIRAINAVVAALVKALGLMG